MSTETLPAHTPTPWRFTGESVLDAKGNNACTKVNGPIIVRAVNSHAELVGALERAIEQIDFTVRAMALGQTVSISSLQNCAAYARASVAKAKGQS